MIFQNTIVRKPGERIVDGIRTRKFGEVEYENARNQHSDYIEALKKCDVRVTVLEADERYPDSTFVEDTAIVTERVAIITNLGVESRRGEEIKIKETLEEFFDKIKTIIPPATLEGGDVMRIEDHFYIGLSNRTNKEGAKQLIDILDKYQYTGCTVPLKEVLHLKSGVAYLSDNNLVAAGEFVDNPIFKGFNIIEIHDDESYVANCIRVNDYVLVAEGYPKARKAIENAGYETIVVDVSEFRKLDGGLSCLSLRF